MRLAAPRTPDAMERFFGEGKPTGLARIGCLEHRRFIGGDGGAGGARLDGQCLLESGESVDLEHSLIREFVQGFVVGA